MPKEYSRVLRVADQIRKDLAIILQFEINDKRLGMITIHDAKLSADLRYADIYVTFMGITESHQSYLEAVSILNKASSYLRMRLGKKIHLRNIPTLRFHYDESLVKGRKLTQLIDKVTKE